MPYDPGWTPQPGLTAGPPGGDDTVSEAASYFLDPAAAPVLEQFPGLSTTVLTGQGDDRMMMVLSATAPGHSVPVHSHPHQQVGVVWAGRARLVIGGQERVVSKGDFYRIPPHVPHGDTCLGDEPFVMLDVFCPVREDFLAKLPRP